MTERETGKPKGYGFCDYKDPDTAVSAMRNLNNSEVWHFSIYGYDSYRQ